VQAASKILIFATMIYHYSRFCKGKNIISRKMGAVFFFFGYLPNYTCIQGCYLSIIPYNFGLPWGGECANIVSYLFMGIFPRPVHMGENPGIIQ
jgi:hypothetical protein